jgi:C4-dicarboxylate-specific signal transduction histidine kinase
MRVSQVSELSGGLAHELTQPLTAILANAQAAREMIASNSADPSAIADVLDDIITEDQRAGEVIERLRSLLRNGSTEFEEIDVNDLCGATLRLLRSELINRHVKADFIPAAGTPRILGDVVQLQQVLLNLVMNAIEAVHRMAASRRAIVLRAGDYSHGMLEITVEDRGNGLGVAEQARIFEPFFTTKEHGLGLGLSICSAIVVRHGGTLALENNPVGGAIAYVRLPVRPAKGGAS